MPEFFLELFSEEIPARMQAGAMPALWNVVSAVGLEVKDIRTYCGPRRIAVSATIASEMPGYVREERGPRETAPTAAFLGFLNKHNASAEEVVTEGGYYLLRRNLPPVQARDALMKSLPGLLLSVGWRKSMRWGQSGDFTWVRPLRRIVCLLDGEVVPITFGPVIASNKTEGHRVHAPGSISVSSASDWRVKLKAHYVIVDQDDRKRLVKDGLAEAAGKLGLTVAPDEALLDEVTGLIEWPVPLIGQIGAEFMDLPPEVRELSMKVNQKYFALRDAEGKPAPYFAFMANLEAPDGGATIIAGNERVLRARLSDARHFWDLDLKTPLNELLPKLDKVTFHAKIGSQRERSQDIADRARKISMSLSEKQIPESKNTIAEQAYWAGLLCKADLVTGMVGEFPELQGIIGGYYASINPQGWDGFIVGSAIQTHYQPKGPEDDIPAEIVPIAVALADKVNTLIKFFAIGERPSGSGDPYALRRAALGIIRIIRENGVVLNLRNLVDGNEAVFNFILERLYVLLRSEGRRHDILEAVGADDYLGNILAKASALNAVLHLENGKNLLAGYKRAANILKIEEASRGRIFGVPDPNLFEQDEERALHQILLQQAPKIDVTLVMGQFSDAMQMMAQMRPYVDAFFDRVTVITEPPELCLNRLQLLALLRDTLHKIADFSKIEG